MFKIRGTDEKEYGPVSGEKLRQWIAQGRANAQTLVQAEGGTEWLPLAALPEFASSLATPPSAVRPAFPVPAAPAPTSGLAIASLVCGVLGCLGITALAGLVTGIMALVKISRSQGRLGGQGIAIVGVCVSGLMVFVSIGFLGALILPGVARARAHGVVQKGNVPASSCVNNVKQMGLGIRLYSVDHQDTFPAAATWCDDIQSSLDSPKAFVCSTDHSGQRCSYAFNGRLGGLKESTINPKTVLVFECKGGWNVSGGPADMITRHGGTYTVGFVDGSVKQVRKSDVATLRWDP